MHNLTARFDRTIARYIEELPRSFAPLMQFATFMGLPAVICVLAFIIAAISWVKGKQRIAYAMAASVVALAGNGVLKLIFKRARPDTMYVANMKIQSYSFPSGHAFGAMVFYGLLAYLAYSYFPAPWNILAAVVLALLIVLIGTSRVFLGAHFPSDVLAGWVLGAICLAIIINFIKP